MDNCINYGCETLGNHTIDTSCGNIVKGGSSAWVILECNHTVTNPSSAAQINANIAAGKAKIITNVKSGFGKPTPVTVDSQTSCGVSETLTYDRTGTLLDGSISDNNIDFWNALTSGRSIGGIIMLECYDAGESPYVTWINAAVKFTGGRVLPNVNTQPQVFDMDFAWRSLAGPQRYDAPVGVTDGTYTFN